MTRALQKKKRKRIGWLMLICLLLLIAFIGEWIKTQYRQQEQRLHQDIQHILSQTEEKLTDSVLNHIVTSVLRSPSGASFSSKDIQIETTVSIDSFPNPDSNAKPNPESLDTNIHRDRNTRVLMIGPEKGAIKNITVQGSHERDSLPELVWKAMRIALLQTANALGPSMYNPSIFGTDTSLIRQQFQRNLNKKIPDIITYWVPTTTNQGHLLVYSLNNTATKERLAIKAYAIYLLKSILPQIVFSIVLLLLITLAFGLAYRTLKEQALFSMQKDSFISNISHELKTPVATTKVALEALTTYKGIEDPERATKYLNVAVWETARLGNMIDRIMDAIQAEQGQLYLQKTVLPLASLLQDIVQNLQPIFTEKQIAIQWNNVDNPIAILADKTHIQATLYNLLDNAVKYGATSIHISLESKIDNVQLRIEDDGPGIALEYQAKIFEPLFRIPSGNRHDVKGHGLGLSYARDIITAHEGTLHVESVPGSGATFIVSLPKIKTT